MISLGSKPDEFQSVIMQVARTNFKLGKTFDIVKFEKEAGPRTRVAVRWVGADKFQVLSDQSSPLDRQIQGSPGLASRFAFESLSRSSYG